MHLKVIEWNINHRLGFSNELMPTWFSKIINMKKVDVIIITECSNWVSNWNAEKKIAFNNLEYLVFSSNNDQVRNSDVTIAVNRDQIEVWHFKSFFQIIINHQII